MTATHLRQRRDARQVGMSPPATAVEAIWGSVLPIPAGPDAGDDFEVRVERAWSYLKTAHFAAAEHDRLREELGKLIAKEGTGE